MNILKIIDKIGEINTDDKSVVSRRGSLFNMGGIGKDLAVAALPIGVLMAASTPAKSASGNVATIVDVLNFALKLEYLEAEYYTMGVASGVIPASDLAIFNQIKKHEDLHVTILKDTITALSGTAVAKPTFDFTAGGAFNPFSVYSDFLALSQAFEDTGVRAYKGQAGNLISNNDVLTAALQIHSVEARHASQVRRLRAKLGLDANNKGWISADSRGTLPAPTQAVYNGENNLSQGGIPDINTITTVGSAAIYEAFDEPLSEADTLAIASLFIV